MNLKNKNFGFTLIELLVGITISTIIMLGVGVLVSSGIGNITTQEKILDNSKNIGNFQENLNSIFNRINKNFSIKKTQSGFISKIDNSFDNGGFSYIGITNQNGLFCEVGSDGQNTNHIFSKAFIPFEEKGEDLFSDFSEILTSKEIIISGKKYKTYQKEHVIKDDSGNIIIGKGIFGNKFIEGGKGRDIYLNSPTGLTSSGNILYISDTLNNRVLAYDTVDDKIYKILDEKNGLLEPTGLFISGSSLFIANSGKGEILEFSSKIINSTPDLTMTGITKNNISEFNIEFFDNHGNKNIDNSLNISDFTFTGYNKQAGDSVSVSNNKVTYSFSGGISQNFNNVDLKISNLTDFSSTGSYFYKTDFDDKYIPFFTQGDGNILTLDDNILEKYKAGLDYPTGIWDDSGNIKYREFYKNVGGGNRSFSNLIFDKNYDFILKVPIKKIDINLNSNLLNLKIDYYKKFNCYNIDDKITRSYLLKKSLK